MLSPVARSGAIQPPRHAQTLTVKPAAGSRTRRREITGPGPAQTDDTRPRMPDTGRHGYQRTYPGHPAEVAQRPPRPHPPPGQLPGHRRRGPDRQRARGQRHRARPLRRAASFTIRCHATPGQARIEVEDPGGPWRHRRTHGDRPHGLDIVAGAHRPGRVGNPDMRAPKDASCGQSCHGDIPRRPAPPPSSRPPNARSPPRTSASCASATAGPRPTSASSWAGTPLHRVRRRRLPRQTGSAASPAGRSTSSPPSSASLPLSSSPGAPPAAASPRPDTPAWPAEPQRTARPRTPGTRAFIRPARCSTARQTAGQDSHRHGQRLRRPSSAGTVHMSHDVRSRRPAPVDLAVQPATTAREQPRRTPGASPAKTDHLDVAPLRGRGLRCRIPARHPRTRASSSSSPPRPEPRPPDHRRRASGGGIDSLLTAPPGHARQPRPGQDIVQTTACCSRTHMAPDNRRVLGGRHRTMRR